MQYISSAHISLTKAPPGVRWPAHGGLRANVHVSMRIVCEHNSILISLHLCMYACARVSVCACERVRACARVRGCLCVFMDMRM